MDVAEEEGWVIEWVFSNVWLTGPVNVNVELQKKEWISRQLLMDIFVTNIGALQKKLNRMTLFSYYLPFSLTRAKNIWSTITLNDNSNNDDNDHIYK